MDRADTSPVNTFTEVTRSRKIEKIYIAFIIKRIKDLKHEYFAIHNVFAQNKKNTIAFMENNMNGKTNVTYSYSGEAEQPASKTVQKYV